LAAFSLPDDGRIAIFELIRTGYDETGTPFRLTITTYPSDRNQFLVTVGQVPSEDTVRPDQRLSELD
jgi:GntR family transcriptional regulator